MSNPAHEGAEKENAAPMAVGSGVKSIAERVSSKRELYHHHDSGATRRFRAAQERVLRVIFAFNELTADEQHLVAERLAEIMCEGEPGLAFGNIEAEARDWALWASPRELRAYAVACIGAMPRTDRTRLLAALGGRGRGRG
jgi:hypothetical protein